MIPEMKDRKNKGVCVSTNLILIQLFFCDSLFFQGVVAQLTTEPIETNEFL